VLDLRLALGAPLAGALVALLADLHPSLRAARMEPVDALRAPVVAVRAKTPTASAAVDADREACVSGGGVAGRRRCRTSRRSARRCT
jgi:hypothetical protein